MDRDTGAAERARARARLERLAAQGLDLPTLWQRATAILATAVPHFRAPCWFTLDPATLLVTSHYDPGIPELPTAWLAHQYFDDDVHKLADVARSVRGVSTIHEATGGEPARSPGWTAYVRPYGGEQELLLALRSRSGEAWGVLGLYREPGRPPFAPEEVAFLRAVAPALAGGARRGLLVGEAAEPEGPAAPGLLVLDADWRVESRSPGVERWLAALPGGDRGEPDALPPAVLAVAGRALRPAAGETAPAEAALSRVRGTDGRWLLLHGTALAGPGPRRVAVIVEPAAPAGLAPLLMAAFGLTAREQDVTRRVLRGDATPEIAAGLHVSPLTVQQHLKRIFEKTGVRSRRELAGRVFLAHYVPRLRDNERRVGGARPIRGGPVPDTAGV